MHITSDEAIELVKSQLGEKNWTCKPFGAGKFSQTFLVWTNNGDQFVLRIAPPDTVLQLFYEY